MPLLVRDPWVLDHSSPSSSSPNNPMGGKRALVASPPRVRPVLEPCTAVPSTYPPPQQLFDDSKTTTEKDNPGAIPTSVSGTGTGTGTGTGSIPVAAPQVQPSTVLPLPLNHNDDNNHNNNDNNDLDNPYSSAYPYPLPKHDVLAPRPPGYVSTGNQPPVPYLTLTNPITNPPYHLHFFLLLLPRSIFHTYSPHLIFNVLPIS